MGGLKSECPLGRSEQKTAEFEVACISIVVLDATFCQQLVKGSALGSSQIFGDRWPQTRPVQLPKLVRFLDRHISWWGPF
jgi:hypothetical protein